ncbi:MAG: acyl-phosphate glycerol 3-phosphate acyltransferase [Ignavibacteria bacterium GWF2_33_9]|nr:MAG: acyl-phosphate glycerol 3-phosphate acyltransferase [Ignavibacteria bacterium GWF2_33_9]
MTTFLLLALIAISSYFIGSIPFGVIISKLFFGFDIREKGSKNMGSTNTFRILGWKAGVAVQVLDILKGVSAVLLAGFIGSGLNIPNHSPFSNSTIIAFSAGIIAILGHMFTIFAGFRGGKGINTAIGMLLAIAPVDLLVAIGVFLIIVSLSGYVSLGSMFASLALPSSLFVRYNFFGIHISGYLFLIWASIILSVLVIYAHRSNIKRLLKGKENQFSKLQLIKIKFLQPKNK